MCFGWLKIGYGQWKVLQNLGMSQSLHVRLHYHAEASAYVVYPESVVSDLDYEALVLD